MAVTAAPSVPPPAGPDISTITIEEEMRRSYLDYAMSVIVARALPDVRDGLKPVHRRILYSMQTNGNLWNRGYRKSARIVGDVIGKYHPHGELAIGGHAAMNLFAVWLSNAMSGESGTAHAPVTLTWAMLAILLVHAALFYALTRVLVRRFCGRRPAA